MMAIMNILATAGSYAGDGSIYKPLGIVLVIVLIVSVILDDRDQQRSRRTNRNKQVTHNNWQANNQQARNHTRQASRPASNSGRDNIPRPKTW